MSCRSESPWDFVLNCIHSLEQQSNHNSQLFSIDIVNQVLDTTYINIPMWLSLPAHAYV